MAGIDDVTPQVNIEGTDEAVAAFVKLAEAGEEAFNRITAAAEQVDKASSGIDKLAKDGIASLSELGIVGAEAFSKIIDAALSGNFTGVVTSMFGKLAGALTDVTEKAYAFVEAQASMAETMSNLAEATGMTNAEIGGLRDAFASVGISTSGFERSIGRLAITIASEWSQIQQSVRTSADAQQSAMIQMEQAAFNVQKSYTAMGEALTSASRTAAHDAIAIQEAAIGLRRASQELGDFALTTRQNSLSIESAQLGLIRARMNLAKDQGYAVSAEDEKALKIEQDKLAVKEAELRLEESKNKKVKEGMEMEELTLKLKKAKMEMADAETKQQEDAIKAAERIKQAHLDQQKADVAQREAAEKAHETDLKDIPAIAKQIDLVAEGQKKWADVMNHTEISAQNMTKALLLASSPGNGQEPKAMDVFREMSKLFQNMGDDADSMNKKLEIVQHTMGAGFRAGQASAAQLLAVLQRGPEALDKFLAEAEKFSKVKLGGFNLDESYKQLTELNSASAQLSTAFDQLKTRFAAMMAVPMTEWFEKMKNSIYASDGSLHLLADSAANLFEIIMKLVTGFGDAFGKAFSAINQIIQSITKLMGLDAGTAVAAMAASFFLLETALGGVATKLALIMGKMFVWVAIIGLVTTAVGDMVKAWALLPTWMGGGKGTFDEGSKIEAMGQSVTRAAAKMAGFDDKQLDEASKNGMKGFFGDSGEMKKFGIAADKESSAADKMGGAGDKHSDAAGKHSEAASKHGDAASKLQDAGASMVSNLGGAGDKLSTAAAALSGAASAIVTAVENMGKSAGGKAGGGKITGPGGPTSDGAGLFALSDGEYVVKSAAVSHYGEGLFEALNSLSLGGFATGGMVGAGVRSATVPSGGIGSGPSSILNLTIDGHEFNGLRAPEHVAAKLKTYVVGRQDSSAGKSPSWRR